MVKNYFSLLKRMVSSIRNTKRNEAKGIYHIKTWKGGRLIKAIGINKVMQVKELKVTGKIDVTDLYFIQHMDNLEVLNLKDAIYLRKKQDEAGKNRLRREIVKDKKPLKEIWFPSSLKSVPSGLLSNCTELERVVLPHTVKTINRHAFTNCGIKELSIPSSVESIAPNAISNCANLKRVIVEDSENLLKWEGEQFSNCPMLSEIYMGRDSTYDYALTTNVELKKLTLGHEIRTVNFDIRKIKSLMCLMKHPPKIVHKISAENVYIKHNFDQFWVHPEWSKEKLQKMKQEQEQD